VAAYQLGSHGAEVERIQKRLKTLGLYSGPIDGAFGGGTQSSVKAFQKKAGLAVDGTVGPITWRALFRSAIPSSGIAAKPLDYRCLALTGTFETGRGPPECFAGLSGDFDGQGLSFGALQWNFGQDTLQPLLNEMARNHTRTMRSIFQSNYDVLLAALRADKRELMRFARSIQHPVTHAVHEPWRGMFKSLARSDAFQAIQVKHARSAYRRAKALASEYGLWSQRGTALMFDIVVQNGGINSAVKERIMAEIRRLPARLDKPGVEVARMQIIANRRAEAAKPVWIEDVCARKLCIADGEGVVHGIAFDLEAQFGIGLVS